MGRAKARKGKKSSIDSKDKEIKKEVLGGGGGVKAIKR